MTWTLAPKFKHHHKHHLPSVHPQFHLLQAKAHLDVHYGQFKAVLGSIFESIHTLMESCNEEVDLPYAHARDLYSTIDSILLGDTPWEGFKVTYNGDVLESSPSWMTKEYEVWYQNPLEVMEAHIGNPDFAQEIDYAPKQVIGKNQKQQYTNLMSGQWAWEQADILAADPETHGSMFAPIILGSDKSTVSVATGQNDYYPLYELLGHFQNHICSSITESKHIKAVKEPWHCLSRNNPIGEMLRINQRLDKLAAAQVDFNKCGMLGVVQGNLVATWPPLPTSAPVNINIDEEEGRDVVEGETSEGSV
ncbi:hypothetical protein BYT27DRAFT_7308890 [Phlegmacium glaucopus]|nr:hypothetical protein BYT27DRAFT_7308890 [Phlegmacium glaucopus]